MIDADALYKSLASAVAEKVLRCPRCHTVETPSSAEIASYFRKGWPRCCGQTMSLVSTEPSQ